MRGREAQESFPSADAEPSHDAHVHRTGCRWFQAPVSVRRPAEDVPPVGHVRLLIRPCASLHTFLPELLSGFPNARVLYKCKITRETEKVENDKKEKSEYSPISEIEWWPRPGSNRRHTDFQSVALPTELPSHRSVFANGRSRGIRTHDPVIKSHLLYQLSYAPIHASSRQMERAKGLEPSTTTLARWHSTN